MNASFRSTLTGLALFALGCSVARLGGPVRVAQAATERGLEPTVTAHVNDGMVVVQAPAHEAAFVLGEGGKEKPERVLTFVKEEGTLRGDAFGRVLVYRLTPVAECDSQICRPCHPGEPYACTIVQEPPDPLQGLVVSPAKPWQKPLPTPVVVKPTPTPTPTPIP